MVRAQGLDDTNVPMDPAALLANQLETWDKLRCRSGFQSVPPELVDATYHCSSQRGHEKLSTKNFTADIVDFAGPTSYLVRILSVMDYGTLFQATYTGIV